MIYQADTYKYDMKNFGRYLDCTHGRSGMCYFNVFTFADFYKEYGKSFNIVLTFGGRSWDDGVCTFGYHYILQDVVTGEYIDPQYRRSTFIPVHVWSLEEYRKEYEDFTSQRGEIPTGDFAAWYGFMYRDYVEAGCLMIRAMASGKSPTKKEIKEMLHECSYDVATKPTLGKSLVKSVIFD